MTLGAVCSNSNNNRGCHMSVALSGATTLAADDTRAVLISADTANTNESSSFSFVVTLSDGTTTFTAQYKVAANTGTWAASNIIVQVY